MTKRTIMMGAMAVVGLVAGYAAAGPPKLDPGLPAYKAVSGVSGNVSSIGSDSLNNLMTLWAESFGKFYPNAKIQIEGKGSSTAPPALIAGTAQLGPMSREMKGTEVDAFEKKYGYKPTPIRTSKRSRSISRSPALTWRFLSAPAVSRPRRVTARTRATSSRGENGLVT